MSSSSGAAVSAPVNSQLAGQTPSPLPVVISCSNNPQVTTVERGRPISLELVQPVPKAGQVASQQGVTSIGITITKDKIQISSNPPPPKHHTATAPQSPRPMNDEAVQVGDGLDCDIGRSWWAPEPEHAEPTILARTPPSPLSSPLSLALSDFEVLLNRELDDFQQLLDSMDSPASNSPLPPSPSQFSPTSSSSSSSSWLDSSLLSSGSSEDQRKEIMSHSNSLLLSCCCPAIIHHRFLLVCYYLSLNLESLVITAIPIPLIRRFDVATNALKECLTVKVACVVNEAKVSRSSHLECQFFVTPWLSERIVIQPSALLCSHVSPYLSCWFKPTATIHDRHLDECQLQCCSSRRATHYKGLLVVFHPVQLCLSLRSFRTYPVVGGAAAAVIIALILFVSRKWSKWQQRNGCLSTLLY